MATTYYSDNDNISYYSDNDNIRGVLIYNTSITDTQVTLTIQSQLEFKTNYHAGYRVESLINDTVVDSAEGYAPKGYTSWTKCVDTGAYTKVYTRTYSDQIITIGSKYYGKQVDYNPGSKSGNTSIKITIPAKQSYSVSYEENGGNDAPSSQTKWYDETLSLSTEIPNRKGYTFLCWNTEPDGSGISYSAGEDYIENSELTLYAQWIKNSNFIPYVKVNSEWKKALVLYGRTSNGWKKIQNIKGNKL